MTAGDWDSRLSVRVSRSFLSDSCMDLGFRNLPALADLKLNGFRVCQSKKHSDRFAEIFSPRRSRDVPHSGSDNRSYLPITGVLKCLKSLHINELSDLVKTRGI